MELIFAYCVIIGLLLILIHILRLWSSVDNLKKEMRNKKDKE